MFKHFLHSSYIELMRVPTRHFSERLFELSERNDV